MRAGFHASIIALIDGVEIATRRRLRPDATRRSNVLDLNSRPRAAACRLAGEQ
jgi:hypothetical protein